MDRIDIPTKAKELFGKYKYVLLVLGLGILLMTLPEGNPQPPQQETPATQPEAMNREEKLEAILSQISGVGKVQVLLTVKTGQTTVYQTDEDADHSDTGSSIRKETVIITDSDRNQHPVVMQVVPPSYLGAVIVCQGADEAGVRLAVVEAVSKATGLGADKISVLKMK
jgi:stage III sporulation protein AG